MKDDVSQIRLRIKETELSRSLHVEGILHARGPLRIGSLVKVTRKCGKPTCRCASGEGHPAVYLSTKVAGKTRMVYIPADCLDTVTQQAQSYRRLRKHRASLAKLSQQSLQLIDRLETALQASPSAKGTTKVGKR